MSETVTTETGTFQVPSYVTPYSETVISGTYRISFPVNVTLNSTLYTFSHWENGEINPIRTIELINIQETLLTAYYTSQLNVLMNLTYSEREIINKSNSTLFSIKRTINKIFSLISSIKRLAVIVKSTVKKIVPVKPYWVCSWCGHKNYNANMTCEKCGGVRKTA